MYGPLKNVYKFFKAKWNKSIHKCAPIGCESSFVLAFFSDLNLVITEKIIHERKYFMSGIGINDLVNEWSGEIVLGTCQVQIMKVSTNKNGTLFLLMRT